MGTNYYARIIPSKSRKEHLKRLIDEDRFSLIKQEVQKMYGESDEYTEEAGEIHLGKRSSGWKFLFNPNYEKYYKLTKEGLSEFLHREDVIIYNEYFDDSLESSVMEYTDDPDTIYDKEYLWTADQFMEMATNWGYNKDRLGWDGKTYEEWERTQRDSTYSYRVGSDPDTVGGGTEGTPIMDHIERTKPDNVIIMTDDDINDIESPVTVPGAVWLLFKGGISNNLIENIHGQTETKVYEI